MTLTTTDRRKDFAGNGIAVDFSLSGLYFLEDDQLAVYDTLDSTGLPTPLVLNSDYTLTGAGNPAGGDLHFVVPPEVGHTINVLRNVPQTQETHYVENDPFPAASHEAALDKLTMLIQQQGEVLDRAITVPPSFTEGQELDPPQEGYVLGWVSGRLRNLASATALLASELLSDVVGKGTDLITYVAAYTGAVGRKLTHRLSDYITPFDFMTLAEIVDVKTGAMTMIVTPAIQAAIDACGVLGKRLRLMTGFYLIDDAASPNNYCLRVTKSLIFEGEGFNAALVPKNTIGTLAATLMLVPDPAYWCKMTVRDMTLGDPTNGTRQGGRGIAIITTAVGSQAPEPLITGMNILKSVNGAEGIEHVNNVANNPNGGMYAALFEHNRVGGGIKLDGSGDSNVIRKNVLSGPNVGVKASLVNLPGTGVASLLVVDENNITNEGGAFKFDGGDNFQFTKNNCEQTVAGGSNGAMIDINCGDATAVSGLIEENHLGAFTDCGISALIRVRNSAGVRVGPNAMIDGGDTKAAGTFVTGRWYAIKTLGTTTWTAIGSSSISGGSFVTGVTYIITSVGTTDFTLIGAASNAIGVVFTASGAGSGSGTALVRTFQATGAGTGNGTAYQAAYGVDIDTSNNTVVGRQQWGSFSPISNMVKLGASATGTMGVRIPLAPYFQNSWVEYDSVNFEASYFIKDENGLVSFVFAVKSGTGTAPTFSVPFTVPAAYWAAKAVYVSLANGTNYGSGYMSNGALVIIQSTDNTNISGNFSYLAADAGGFVNVG